MEGLHENFQENGLFIRSVEQLDRKEILGKCVKAANKKSQGVKVPSWRRMRQERFPQFG